MIRQRNKGLTLLDTLAAIGIIAMLASSMTWLTALSERVAEDTRCRVSAVWLAEGCMSYLRQHPAAVKQINIASAIPTAIADPTLLPDGQIVIGAAPWGDTGLIETRIAIIWESHRRGRVELTALIDLSANEVPRP